MNHIKKWHTAFADLTDFHGFRNDFIWKLCVLLLVTLISDVSAQEVTDKELYTILIQQVNIYSEIESFDEEKIILLNHAVSYADSGDHEVAVIYLEELLDQLQFLNNKTDILKAEEYPFEYDVMPISKKVKKSSRFRLSAITGIDYNRQEFEISYFENDSAILEQISRPYIGIFAGFIYQFNPVYSLEITNSLRYDNDYLRNDYRIIWRAGTGIALQYNGYWNQSESVLASSFWEHEIDARFYSRINPTFALSIQNNFRHKTWSGISSYISDYNRNRFFAVADWQRFRLEYINELNESLGTEDLDYLQHSIRFGLRNQPGWQLTYDLEMDFTLRNYTLAFEDSILNNLYHQAGINLYFTLPLTGLVKLVSEDNFIYKSYNDKNSLEPDYLWNFFRPGLVINVARSFDITLGYEWEFRTHLLVSNDIFDVSEQNYNSDGIFLSLSYLNTTGSYFSASVSYQWRRYPQSATNDILSLYSNRNILSVTAMVNWPLLTNLFLNTYIMYDNDQDIDLDQQNNHSTIFTAELEYKF